MDDIAVRVHDLGKRYQLGMQRNKDSMLREAISDGLRWPIRKMAAAIERLRGRGPDPATRKNLIWALRHVSFEVPRGQIIGIIGPNGAGKSTLLKILSRITDPTEGRVEIRGRVGSLLEVGTGFHPELTGRENSYLSGALLGMRKTEIDRKLDEILAFAEIEKFADTPVKYYSSGMYVRLAFAVAAHLEPEILIVDEVLAVGDVAFQRKCLSKMEDVREHGRTILFVSHNMQAVTRLCERAILISRGSIREDGPATTTAASYLVSSFNTPPQQMWGDPETAPGDEAVRLRSIRVRNEEGETLDTIGIKNKFAIEFTYDVLQDDLVLVPSLQFNNESGTCVFVTQDLEPQWRGKPRPRGRFVAAAWIPGNFLAEGALFVSVSIGTQQPLKVHAHQRDTVALHIVDSFDGESARGDWDGVFPGQVRPLLEWQTEWTAPTESKPEVTAP